MADKEREKQELVFQSTASPDEAANYLQSVVDGLRQRALLAESGNDSIEMIVAGDVKFEVEFNASAKKSSISIAIGWRSETPEPAARPTLSVLSGRDMAEREVEIAEEHEAESEPSTNGMRAASDQQMEAIAAPTASASVNGSNGTSSARTPKKQPAPSRATGSTTHSTNGTSRARTAKKQPARSVARARASSRSRTSP